MKKIYSILLIALAVFTGCQKWVDEEPIAKVATVDPTITTSAVSDSSFTATISGVDGTSYYAYAVLEGDKILINETKLFQKGLGSGYAEGVVNYAEKPSTTIVLKDLVPNTKYTVYAIAGNSQSFTGNVVTATVLTSDGLTPEFEKASASDSVFTITYNEPVKKGEGAITAYVMARNLSWTEPLDSFEVPADNISIKGSVMTVTVPGAPAGAYVVLGFEEGVVTNMVDTPSEAYSALMEGAYEDWGDEDFEENEYVYDIYSHMSNDTWEFEWQDENAEGDTLIYIAPGEATSTYVVFDCERTPATMPEIEDKYPVRMTYVDGGKVSSIPASWDVTATDDGIVLYFTMPEDLPVLATASMSIAEGILEDIFGNPNAAYEREDAYSCLLISDGIAGVYKFSYEDAWGDINSGEVIFAENEDGTYSVYDLSPYLASNGFSGPVIAIYNEEKKQLEIASEQVYFTTATGTSYLFYAFTADLEDLKEDGVTTLSVLENGWLHMNDGWGVTPNLQNFGDLAYGDYDLIKISNDVPELATTASFGSAANLRMRTFSK